MKAISLKKVYHIAKTSRYSDFEQQMKADLTEQSSTTVINCEPVLVDKKELLNLISEINSLNSKGFDE